MAFKHILCVLLLSHAYTHIYATDSIQRLVDDALCILGELEQQKNLYIPRVLNKELNNLLTNASDDELIAFMQEVEKLENKQLINSTAAVIVDRYNLSTRADNQQLLENKMLPSSYAFIKKYMQLKKGRQNSRACGDVEFSVQNYVDTYGIPAIYIGSIIILNFDSANITSLYGMQNISLSNVALIFLSNNCIQGATTDPQFPAEPFVGVPDTVGIFLHNNSIESLPATFLNGLPYISNITLGNNELSNLPTDIFSAHDIIWLSLSNNFFSSTDTIDITGMPNLQIFDIGGNPLGSLSETYFANNNALTDIYVNNDSLIDWPTSLLDATPFLQFLDASFNELETFLPASIPDGSTVILTGNPISSGNQEIIQSTYPEVNFEF